MAGPPEQPVVLTGASGTLGRLLACRLAGLGWQLRLTDISPFPDPLPNGISFERIDLENGDAIARIVDGCGLILHLGGISTEQKFEAILQANLRGVFHVFEAARRNKARVVFASSNHAVGLHARSKVLGQDCQLRPDGFYGLSKAYGELLARMYWDKHGVESVLIRIGSVLQAVLNERTLSTWLSPDDFVRLIECCASAKRLGCSIIWGASANSRGFWRDDARGTLGWMPQDSADSWTDRVLGKVSDDPLVEHFQGGAFVRIDYSRDGLPPDATFGDD